MHAFSAAVQRQQDTEIHGAPRCEHADSCQQAAGSGAGTAEPTHVNREWRFHIPIKTARGGNNREHHMARARRVNAERFATAALIRSTMAQQRARMPALPVQVTLTRHGPGELDGDNLQGALKAIRDEVAAWLKADDADPRITWAYGQVKSKLWGVNIRVQEVQP